MIVDIGPLRFTRIVSHHERVKDAREVPLCVLSDVHYFDRYPIGTLHLIMSSAEAHHVNCQECLEWMHA